MGAVFAPTRFSSVRISIRELVADGKSLVRNSGVGGGGQNLILILYPQFQTQIERFHVYQEIYRHGQAEKVLKSDPQEYVISQKRWPEWGRFLFVIFLSYLVFMFLRAFSFRFAWCVKIGDIVGEDPFCKIQNNDLHLALSIQHYFVAVSHSGRPKLSHRHFAKSLFTAHKLHNINIFSPRGSAAKCTVSRR